MKKRKMIQHNLLKNAVSAYFAAIEVHNKPNISYRYETVTLLMMNAWELVLKAFIRKYVKEQSIFEGKKRNTITFGKALAYTAAYINKQKPKSFVAVQQNLEAIEEYRNEIAHFYCEGLEACIFTLVARAALNFVEFVKVYFNKDIMNDDELFIMPLGFKLPFHPEDFLSTKSANYPGGEEAKAFIEHIVNRIRELDADSVDDSIVLGFEVYLNSVNKITNKALLAAIDSKDKADIIIAKEKQIKLTQSPGAQEYNMSDDEYREIYKYTYKEWVAICREKIEGFKVDKKFRDCKREIELDPNCVYVRKLDNDSETTATKKFYSDYAVDKIVAMYKCGDV